LLRKLRKIKGLNIYPAFDFIYSLYRKIGFSFELSKGHGKNHHALHNDSFFKVQNLKPILYAKNFISAPYFIMILVTKLINSINPTSAAFKN